MTDAERIRQLAALLELEPLYRDHSDAACVVPACVYCDGMEDEMNRVFLHAGDCPWAVAKFAQRADAARPGVVGEV